MNLIPNDEEIGPDLSVERVNSIGKVDDVHGSTTTVQGCCALSTDTPPPVVARDLVEHDQPATRAPVLQAIEEQSKNK